MDYILCMVVPVARSGVRLDNSNRSGPAFTHSQRPHFGMLAALIVAGIIWSNSPIVVSEPQPPDGRFHKERIRFDTRPGFPFESIRPPFGPTLGPSLGPPFDLSLAPPSPSLSNPLDLEIIDRIRNNCNRGRCKDQKQGNLNRRNALKELRSKSLQKSKGRRKGKTKHEADELVEENFSKTFATKRAYYNFLGLLDVADPSDDGFFAGDMILSNEQLDSFLHSLQTFSSRGKRKRRSATYFEDPTLGGQIWDVPIPYFVDTFSGITFSQRNLINTALSDITNSTAGRITFTQLDFPIDSPYLEYTAMDTQGICGGSTIGKQNSDNTIYGTILHETMHALGCAHTHTRTDRDTFVRVNWNNIDSFCYDSFAINDINVFTSYGSRYSYGSVMHYANTACAIDQNTPTLIATQPGPVMGQRFGLDPTDIDLLNRAYCCGAVPNECSCQDNHVYCGYWTNSNYCNDGRYRSYMIRNCAKSCNVCTCSLIR